MTDTPLEFNHATLGMTYYNIYLVITEKIFPSQAPTLLLIILKRLSSVKNPDMFFFLQLKSNSNFIKESAIQGTEVWITDLTF